MVQEKKCSVSCGPTSNKDLESIQDVMKQCNELAKLHTIFSMRLMKLHRAQWPHRRGKSWTQPAFTVKPIGFMVKRQVKAG